MLRDESSIRDILEAADRISTYIDGLTHDTFVSNLMARAAVVREMEIMGEETKRLSSEYRDGHPEVPWKQLSRLRDLYIHAYDRIDYDRVWHGAKRLMPKVADIIRPLIAPNDEDKLGPHGK